MRFGANLLASGFATLLGLSGTCLPALAQSAQDEERINTALGACQREVAAAGRYGNGRNWAGDYVHYDLKRLQSEHKQYSDHDGASTVLASCLLASMIETYTPPTPRPPRQKAPPPTFNVLRNDGPSCVKFNASTPVLTSDGKRWHTDFDLTNNCSVDVLVWYDFGEADKGEDPSEASIRSNSLPLITGSRMIGWMKDTPPRLSFSPRNPDGTGAVRIYSGSSHTGSTERDADAGATPRAFYVWMVSCRAFVDHTPPPPFIQSLFVEDKGLGPIGRFECLPNGVEPF